MHHQHHSPRPERPGRTFPTAHDLPRETRESVVRRLNQRLADTTDLMTQLKVAHWNVKGMNFYQLHLLFDEVAEVLETHADMLAERATSLGGQAMGTVRMAAANSGIPELPERTTTGPDYLEATTEHLAIHAANLRADIDAAAADGDEGTADLFTELSREVDQQLYFLESHLQGQSIGTTDGTGTADADPLRAAPSLDGPRSRQPSQRVTFGGPAGAGGAQGSAQGQARGQGQIQSHGQQRSGDQLQQPPQQ